MAIEQKTIVDQIEINSENLVFVRFILLLIKDGTELSRRYHRTSIPMNVENGAILQMYEVNTHLLQMGEAAVGQKDIDRIAAFTEFTKTQA